MSKSNKNNNVYNDTTRTYDNQQKLHQTHRRAPTITKQKAFESPGIDSPSSQPLNNNESTICNDTTRTALCAKSAANDTMLNGFSTLSFGLPVTAPMSPRRDAIELSEPRDLPRSSRRDEMAARDRPGTSPYSERRQCQRSQYQQSHTPTARPVIPNVFFAKPTESIDTNNHPPMRPDLNELSFMVPAASPRLSIRSHQSPMSLAPKSQLGSPQQNFRNLATNELINSQLVQGGTEYSYRSVSTSPRINRRVQNVVEQDFSQGLNVPNMTAISRKLSLQPALQQQVAINDLTTMSPGSGSISPTTNIPFYPNTGLNNLTVSSQHMAPRKSVIGRQLLIERSSFQTQRLSDVGVAFGQQITAKMGLKLPASQERIVEQTRWLYLRYVFVRLRQHSLPLRDLNLTKSSRARRAAAIGAAPAITYSAPTTAATRPTFSNSSSNDKLTARKRLTDGQGGNLTILKTKIRTLRQNHIISNPTDSSDSSATESTTTTNNNTSLGPRRYIMDPALNGQIFNVIVNIIKELREMKPDLYGDTIYELIGVDKFTSLDNLLEVQRTICQEMIRSEISWCRIAALFSLFGAMSLDCVRVGAPEHVGPIADNFVEFVERDLALWISQQGGWETFLYNFQAGFRFRQCTAKAIGIAVPILLWIIISMFR